MLVSLEGTGLYGVFTRELYCSFKAALLYFKPMYLAL